MNSLITMAADVAVRERLQGADQRHSLLRRWLAGVTPTSLWSHRPVSHDRGRVVLHLPVTYVAASPAGAEEAVRVGGCEVALTGSGDGSRPAVTVACGS